MAQSKGNKPYKEFYRQNGLERALMGDFTHLRESSFYILGVSATPFSELVATYRVSQEDNHCPLGAILLTPGTKRRLQFRRSHDARHLANPMAVCLQAELKEELFLQACS